MNKSNLYKLTLSYKSTALGFKVEFLCEKIDSLVFHEAVSHILISMAHNPTYAISLKKEHLLKEIPVHEACFFQQCSYSSLIESGGEGHLGCYIINDSEVCNLEDRLAKIEAYLKEELRNKIEKAFKQEDDYFDRVVSKRLLNRRARLDIYDYLTGQGMRKNELKKLNPEDLKKQVNHGFSKFDVLVKIGDKYEKAQASKDYDLGKLSIVLDVINEDEFYLAENTYKIVKSEF